MLDVRVRAYRAWSNHLAKHPEKPRPQFIAGHICSQTCPFFEHETVFICEKTGNDHVCTIDQCDFLRKTDQAAICGLTCMQYPLHVTQLDNVKLFHFRSRMSDLDGEEAEEEVARRRGDNGESNHEIQDDNEDDDAGVSTTKEAEQDEENGERECLAHSAGSTAWMRVRACDDDDSDNDIENEGQNKLDAKMNDPASQTPALELGARKMTLLSLPLIPGDPMVMVKNHPANVPSPPLPIKKPKRKPNNNNKKSPFGAANEKSGTKRKRSSGNFSGPGTEQEMNLKVRAVLDKLLLPSCIEEDDQDEDDEEGAKDKEDAKKERDKEAKKSSACMRVETRRIDIRDRTGIYKRELTAEFYQRISELCAKLWLRFIAVSTVNIDGIKSDRSKNQDGQRTKYLFTYHCLSIFYLAARPGIWKNAHDDVCIPYESILQRGLPETNVLNEYGYSKSTYTKTTHKFREHVGKLQALRKAQLNLT